MIHSHVVCFLTWLRSRPVTSYLTNRQGFDFWSWTMNILNYHNSITPSPDVTKQMLRAMPNLAVHSGKITGCNFVRWQQRDVRTLSRLKTRISNVLTTTASSSVAMRHVRHGNSVVKATSGVERLACATHELSNITMATQFQALLLIYRLFSKFTNSLHNRPQSYLELEMIFIVNGRCRLYTDEYNIHSTLDTWARFMVLWHCIAKPDTQ